MVNEDLLVWSNDYMLYSFSKKTDEQGEEAEVWMCDGVKIPSQFFNWLGTKPYF